MNVAYVRDEAKKSIREAMRNFRLTYLISNSDMQQVLIALAGELAVEELENKPRYTNGSVVVTTDNADVN